MEHATLPILVLFGLFALFVLALIARARRGRPVFLRRIAGLEVIDDAIGRATEQDRPIMFNPGLDDLGVQLFCSMAVMGYVVRKAARLSMPVYVPIARPLSYAIAEEYWKDGYAAMQREGSFAVEECIRYLSGDQNAFGMATAGWIKRERVGANFLFGGYGFEAMIIAEAGQQAGAIQVACTHSFFQVPFFVVTCDYTVFGEEFYAAGAYFSRDPVLTGTLAGQDYCKLVILVLILVGVVGVTLLQQDWVGLVLMW
ncbi:MAG: hypothetical protein N2595_06905 [bacterium]|nr:hypothetical protein [bacterium]